MSFFEVWEQAKLLNNEGFIRPRANSWRLLTACLRAYNKKARAA